MRKKVPIKQLDASKTSTKDLFSDLSNETKGFKYQTTLKVLLKYTRPMKTLNLDQFTSIRQRKQW